MDRSDKLQDNPNIEAEPASGPMKAISTYALYGELSECRLKQAIVQHRRRVDNGYTPP
jgi:hypothetical protein